MAVVFVGAAFVGKISTYFAPICTNTGDAHPGEVLLDEEYYLERGAQLGAFHMGSTVVVLHEAPFEAHPDLGNDSAILLGAEIGSIS